MTKYLILLGTTLLVSACAMSPEEAENEMEIDLDAVPANVIAAATSALPGIELSEAEYEEEEGLMVYELEGMLGDTRYEIEITPEGEVLEIEQIDD